MFKSDVEVDIELWDLAEIRRLPGKISLNASFGAYLQQVVEEEGMVRYRKGLEINRRRVEAGEYPQLREMILRERNENHRILVIGGE